MTQKEFSLEYSIRLLWGLPNAEASDVALKCPTCGKFSAESWFSQTSSPDGHLYFGGGICSTHSDWINQFQNTGWF